MSDLTRRAFLQTSVAAGAAATFRLKAEATGVNPAEATGPAAGPEVDASVAQPAAATWFDRPMRWVQLTLVENDPGRFDPRFWLEYFRSLHADAATLSAGGIVAYYPTEVPLHHRSSA